MMDEKKLFVAMLLPFFDGSGSVEVLGAYSTKEKAEARCYRKTQELGYDQPTSIFELTLDSE